MQKNIEQDAIPFHNKSVQNLELEGNYLNIIMEIIIIISIIKPTANIMLSGERLKAFPLSSETRQA